MLNVDKRDWLGGLNCGDSSKFDPEQNERWRLRVARQTPPSSTPMATTARTTARARRAPSTKKSAARRASRASRCSSARARRGLFRCPARRDERRRPPDDPPARRPQGRRPPEIGPDPYNPDCEGPIFEGRVVSRLNPKGMLPCPTTKRTAVTGKKKKQPAPRPLRRSSTSKWGRTPKTQFPSPSPMASLRPR